MAGAGEAAWQCGDLLVSHSMPGYTTMGRERSLTLIYNSAQAVPKMVVAANVTNGDISMPQSVQAVLSTTTATSNGVQLLQDSTTYSGWHLDPNPRQIVITHDASDTTKWPTGAYPFTLEVRNKYPSPYGTTRTGTFLIVNRTGSVFGAGWSLAGVEQLYRHQPVGTGGDDILWVGGDGSARLYKKLDASHWAAPRGVYQDTLIYNSQTGEYTRTLRHKIQVVFDTLGHHLRTVNRFEQATRFTWNQTDSGKLISIAVPPDTTPNQTYRLKYTGGVSGRLDSLVDPAGRGLDITISSNRITSITDPDGIATSFGYDGSTARMLTRTNRRNYRTRFEYANNLRVTKVVVPGGPTGMDSSITQFQPWDEKGIASSAVRDTGVYTMILGPRVNIPDDAKFWVDKWGAPTKIINAIGATTLLTRGDTTVPQLVTRVDFPNGRIGIMKYDARGNLTEARDSTWHLASAARDSTRFTTYQYSDANAPDSPSLVGDSYSRYSHFWYNATFGVPDSTKDLRNLTTIYRYRASGALQGLMDTVTEKGITVWKESISDTIVTDLITSFSYDGLGRLRTTTTPSGNVSADSVDAYGRILASYDPLGDRVTYSYDALNRMTRSYQHTAKFTLPFSVSQNCDTTQLFCADSTRQFSPSLGDSLGSTFKLGASTLDTVIDPRGAKRAFGYDAQGMQRIEQDEFGYQKVAFYDAAGLMDSLLTRDSIKVRFKYDSLGRQVFMSFPQRSTPFAADGDNTVIPGDTVLYTYDNMGNLLTAQNRWNTTPIRRTYYANGSLRTQVTNGDSLYFEYNQNGQRKRMIRNARDTVDYAYNSGSGDLQTVTVRWDTTGAGSIVMAFGFTFDKFGRRVKVTYPGNIVVTLAYDKNGTLRQLKSVNSAHPSGTDRLDFTWRNRDVDAVGRILRQTASCDGELNPTDDELPCGNGSVETTNRYNRFGMMVWQRPNIGINPDSMAYDSSGSMIYHKHPTGEQQWLIPTIHSNRLAYDYNQTFVTVNYTYNREGARLKEQPSDSSQFQLWKWYYYDGLGRLTGTRYATWEQIGQNDVIVIHQNADSCRYNADGQMVLPCDLVAPTMFLDGPNVVGNAANWNFVHGPGIDDPLVALSREAGTGRFYKFLFIVTDGNGRRYSVGRLDGTLWPEDLGSDPGWRYSGVSGGSNTFGSARMNNPNLPDIAYFRNRAYDSRTGRWTQEDPIGLAGGMNLYQFNGNNPATYNDPFGLDCPKHDFWCKLYRAGATVLGFIGGGALGGGQGGATALEACGPAAETCAIATVPAAAVLGSITGALAGYASSDPDPGNFLRSEDNSSGRGSSQPQAFKVPRPGATGRAGSTNIPSWARGQKPYVGESGGSFARRLLNDKYGIGNWKTGPTSEYNILQKYADRHFMDPLRSK